MVMLFSKQSSLLYSIAKKVPKKYMKQKRKVEKTKIQQNNRNPWLFLSK